MSKRTDILPYNLFDQDLKDLNTKLLFVLGIIGIFGFSTSTVEGNVDAPFDFETNGLQVTDFEVDSSKFEIILQVNVYDNPATLELTFDRDFFDSRYQNADDDYVIIADGDRVYYEELENNSESRTIAFGLNQGINEVEIFGTHLNGLTYQPSSDEKLQALTSLDVPEEKVDSQLEQLIKENENLANENKALKEENQKLDSRIFELENLVSALQHQVNSLKEVVSSQVKIMLGWLGTSN